MTNDNLKEVLETLVNQHRKDVEKRPCKETQKVFTHGYNVGFAAALYQLVSFGEVDYETADLVKKNFFFGNQIPNNIIDGELK